MSRQFILDEHPDAIIDIIDATNIRRNLYLTLQLMELDRPMVIALNMMDSEVTANGGAVDVNLLEAWACLLGRGADRGISGDVYVFGCRTAAR